MGASMADQATNAGGRSSIDPHPETSAAGAAALGDASAAAATPVASGDHPVVDASADQQATGAQDVRGESGGPGFGERGRMRRRLRFLRKARELAYRDLGGLVFEMQRLGERRDELAAAKLATLAAIDTELRALERALGDRRALTILRESGIAACPRCAAIHGSDDRFCPSCGLAMERRAERPIAVAAPAGPGARAAATAGTPAATAATAATAASSMAVPPSAQVSPPGSFARTPQPPAPAPQPLAPTQQPRAPAPQPPTPTPQAPTPAPRAPVRAPQPPTPPSPAPAMPQAPRPQAPQPAGDDRPTEIIRPPDAGSRGDA
jgi:hypothetical protein